MEAEVTAVPNVHFSSATVEWETPQALFDQLNAEFGFTLDVCATHENAKCRQYFTEAGNGLAAHWGCWASVAWMNPPYGRVIGQWVEKAATSGIKVVCLLPSRTDTRWWHRWIWDKDKHAPRPGVQVRFLAGRLKFGNATNAAPFPSVVVVFNGGAQ